MSALLPWDTLVFGSFNKAEIALAVADPTWQALRYSMLDLPLADKFSMLRAFVSTDAGSPPLELRRIAVTNYVHALARGGLIPPAGER